VILARILVVAILAIGTIYLTVMGLVVLVPYLAAFFGLWLVATLVLKVISPKEQITKPDPMKRVYPNDKTPR
jgi:hypothetical protein